MGFFGFMPIRDHSAVLEMSRQSLEKDKGKLKEQISSLETQLFLAGKKKDLPLPVVDLDMGDPEPTDAATRKMYVARVAQFHHETMEPKLLSLISDARGQFEQISRDLFGLKPAEYDLFLKGTINGLWLIHEWGRSMVNEQLADTQEAAEAISDAELQTLKGKIE